MLDGKKQKYYTSELLQDTTILLGLNPEFNAVWNYRRNIFSHLFETKELDRVQALNSDLLMSMEMMKRFPKCYWIWNHRRWCLETLQMTRDADWARELAIVLKVLMMDSRNFHGWHYRRYVAGHIEAQAGENNENTLHQILEVNLREFDYTTEIINKSTSNFSAWHNRTKLITKIFEILAQSSDSDSLLDSFSAWKSAPIFKSALSLLKHELNLVKTGMFMDVDDTSVWLYMQWLLTDPLFVKGLPTHTYLEILDQQLADVNELNQLEKEDSPKGAENVWCLKTIIFLREIRNRYPQNPSDGIDEETNRALNLLVELDPLRKGHYLDQLQGKESILC